MRMRAGRCDARLNYRLRGGFSSAPGYSDAVRAVGLLLALAAAIVAGCGGGSAAEEAMPATGTTTAPTETAPPAGATDRPRAPAIEGVSLDGARISLAEFRGRPVFVNVWSSW